MKRNVKQDVAVVIIITAIIAFLFIFKGYESGMMALIIAVGMGLFSSLRFVILNKSDIVEDLNKLTKKTKHYLLFLVMFFILAFFIIILLITFHGKQ